MDKTHYSNFTDLFLLKMKYIFLKSFKHIVYIWLKSSKLTEIMFKLRCAVMYSVFITDSPTTFFLVTTPNICWLPQL